LLNVAVKRQFLFMQRHATRQLRSQPQRAQSGIGTQAHHEFVAQIHRWRRLGGPAPQFGLSGGQCAVDAFTGLAGVGRAARRNPTRQFHASKLTVNLLVGGVPKETDGFVKAARQVVAGR